MRKVFCSLLVSSLIITAAGVAVAATSKGRTHWNAPIKASVNSVLPKAGYTTVRSKAATSSTSREASKAVAADNCDEQLYSFDNKRDFAVLYNSDGGITADTNGNDIDEDVIIERKQTFQYVDFVQLFPVNDQKFIWTLRLGGVKGTSKLMSAHACYGVFEWVENDPDDWEDDEYNLVGAFWKSFGGGKLVDIPFFAENDGNFGELLAFNGVLR